MVTEIPHDKLQELSEQYGLVSKIFPNTIYVASKFDEWYIVFKPYNTRSAPIDLYHITVFGNHKQGYFFKFEECYEYIRNHFKNKLNNFKEMS